MNRSIFRTPAAVAIFALAIALALAVACGGGSDAQHPTEVCGSDAAGDQIKGGSTLPPGGPPSFPYIFHGEFEVDGEPGPAGVTIFARIGGAKSPSVSTGAGTYRNIIIGPLTPEDIEADLQIFLGDPDKSPVKADQVFRFTSVSAPTTYTCVLSFPRLP